jgi:hypothetical protein
LLSLFMNFYLKNAGNKNKEKEIESKLKKLE